MTKKNDIKEYGTDLLKQYNDLQAKQKHLDAKIRKRAKLVLNQHGYDANAIDQMKVKYLLPLIIRAEEKYASESQQLNIIFNQNKDND